MTSHIPFSIYQMRRFADKAPLSDTKYMGQVFELIRADFPINMASDKFCWEMLAAAAFKAGRVSMWLEHRKRKNNKKLCPGTAATVQSTNTNKARSYYAGNSGICQTPNIEKLCAFINEHAPGKEQQFLSLILAMAAKTEKAK